MAGVARIFLGTESSGREAETMWTRRDTFDGDGLNARRDNPLATDQDFNAQAYPDPTGPYNAAADARSLKADFGCLRQQETNFHHLCLTLYVQHD